MTRRKPPKPPAAADAAAPFVGDVSTEPRVRAKRGAAARSFQAEHKKALAALEGGSLGLGRRGSAVSANIRQKGIVTIPQQIREALNLEEGDPVIFSIREGNIVLTPAAVVPRDQEWFWTPEWQSMEAEADAEIVAGGGTVYESGEDFVAALKAV